MFGILPEAGGLYDQGARFVDALTITLAAQAVRLKGVLRG